MPTEVPNRRGPEWVKEWARIRARILTYAEANLHRGPYGKAGWVKFPGGYQQLRAVCGLSTRVDLSFTGKMLKDVMIKSNVVQLNRTKQKKGIIARLELEASFKTVNSGLIATRVQTGKFGRPFFFFTDKEIEFLTGYLEILTEQAIGLTGRDARGRFTSLTL